ncbi:L,D-transpeptidase [Patescibacteria group bacterium]
MDRLNFFLLLTLGFIVSFSVLLLPKNQNKDANIAYGCAPTELSGEISSERVAQFEGKRFEISGSALADLGYDSHVLGDTNSNKWIEVDLSEQTLIAWEGNSEYLRTPVSTGLPWWPTPTGEFRIWIKLRATKMEGGEGEYYYYLPNVPYVMFFENDQVPGWHGYGLHGTYWHNDFGTPRSHGCVNLPTETAGALYNWVDPHFTRSKYSAKSTTTNQGTRIIIHE